MSDRRRRITIGPDAYMLVATIEEGQSLSFYAGRAIAVEKMDMRPGGTEFDFDVHSRRTSNGRAESIAITRDGIRNEFTENRVKSNLYGLPISLGNAVAVARGQASAELTYGELQPQVFSSRVETDPVAWTIDFRRAHYNGMARRGVRRPPPAKWVQAGGQAAAMAGGSAAIASQGSRPEPGQASGGLGLPTTDAVLRLYVRVADITRYRPSPRSFGGHDMIFDTPGVFERLGNMLGLR